MATKLWRNLVYKQKLWRYRTLPTKTSILRIFYDKYITINGNWEEMSLYTFKSDRLVQTLRELSCNWISWFLIF